MWDVGCIQLSLYDLQQSLAKYSGLRMTQTVYGCGLALRVVCVNFLNTCPIAP